MYSRGPLPLTLRHAPSLLPGHLSCTTFGDRGFRLAYVHKDELVLVESKNGSGFERTVKLELKNTQVFSAAFTGFGYSNRGRSSSSGGGPMGSSIGGGGAGPEYLVICSNLGAQLWSADGERMEWFHQLTDLLEDLSDPTDLQHHFLRASCGLQSVTGLSCVALGSSVGTVYILNTAGDVLHRLSTQSSSAVSALAASGQFLFCANDNGDVLGYRVGSGFETLLRCPGRGDACTALCCRGGVAVAGFVTGHIRLYRADRGEMCIEVAAHARSLSALALHPSAPYFASVGEDQYLRVWALPDFLTPSGSDLDLAHSSRLEHCLCTGVAWTPSDGRLLVTSYDSDDLAVFHPSS